MTKLISAVAALVALAIPATGSSKTETARWVSYPECSATSTSLTCTFRVAGLRITDPNKPYYLGNIWGQVLYTCNADPTILGHVGASGFPLQSALVQNGQAVTITYTPTADPESGGGYAEYPCPGNTWTRDLTYYGVLITITNGFGDMENPVLFADIGDVSPE